jgi:hypothetical protein
LLGQQVIGHPVIPHDRVVQGRRRNTATEQHCQNADPVNPSMIGSSYQRDLGKGDGSRSWADGNMGKETAMAGLPLGGFKVGGPGISTGHDGGHR